MPEEAPNGDELDQSRLGRIKQRLGKIHAKIPLLKKLPPRAVAIVLLLVLVNIIIWIAAGIVLVYYGFLTPTAVLAYTLGLRHALDADHISAIDLMTRRLVASGQRPVTVGTWFSLGHSTIVIITSIIVAATASAVSQRFGSFSEVGGIIGSSVSSAFLLILGLANLYILYLLVRQIRRILAAPPNLSQTPDLKFDTSPNGGGPLFRLFKRLFKLIDRPYKIYPLGILFGLGFDTSSEIALLGIASLQSANGTSLWLILILPVLFTAGMCLLDTLDGALMMALYTAASRRDGGGGGPDPLAVLYYNVALTGVTVLVAGVIGTLQALGLVVAVRDPDGEFWDGVRAALDRYDIIGGAICGAFVLAGVMSVALYRPWRRWVEERRRKRFENAECVMEAREGEAVAGNVEGKTDDDVEVGVDRRLSQDGENDHEITPTVREEIQSASHSAP